MVLHLTNQAELSALDWQVLRSHKGKERVSSEELQKELGSDNRSIADSLHRLHYEGMIYFITLVVAGNEEYVISKITRKGIVVLQEPTNNFVSSSNALIS